ncbi:hypothetical protein CLI64_23685 [Nostoc sp. CENA543]|uniref:hypothetical protein n=1 Tax=Nostoc sp. CENA543 TaxID=1869241 RepID=UPI000CA284F7|nr:hypothetical protein [Nostoc sp. CENA543]AUT03169.1 hypothetical protein CLI64_23685 [Nostoc sp. CENA543]
MINKQVKIHQLLGIEGATLLVFTTDDCWQFRVLTVGGAVFGERKIYFTPHTAEKAAREWIHEDCED